VRLQLVGDERHPGDRSRLEDLTRELHLEGTVNFVGWLDRSEVALL